MTNHNRRKRKFNFISIYFIFILFLSITTSTLDASLTTVDENEPEIDINILINEIHFSNDFYTGYISENVAAVKQFNNFNDLNSRLVNARTRSASSPTKSYIYIRFVDLIKPSLRVSLNQVNQCSRLALKKINLDLITSDQDLFELDLDSNCFNLNQTLCECPIKIRLKDDASRDLLNREAQDVYMLQLSLIKQSLLTNIKIRILDDNDLEPMFDPSEYLIVLNDTQNLVAFSQIGKVVARDPDLSRNSLVRYYINCNQFNSDSNWYSSSEDTREIQVNQINNNCNKYFGVDWLNGDIYLKKSLDLVYQNLFEDNIDENEIEIKLEIKAVDTGLKLNIANNLLNQPTNNQKYRQLNRTMRRFKTFDYDDESDDEFELIKSTDFKEDDLINYKLIKSAANLKPTFQIKSISINNNNNNNNNRKNIVSYYGTSLEAALVRIKLQRTSLKHEIRFTKLIDLDNSELNEQVKFKLEKYSNAIIPFGLLESKSDNLNLIITSESKLIQFKLEKIYLNSNEFNYLIFIEPNYNDLISFKVIMESSLSSSHLYSIKTCHLKKCVHLTQFEFNLSIDLVNLIQHLCSMQIYVNENNLIKLNKFTSLNSTLFKLNYKFQSIYSNEICQSFLLTENRFLNQSLFYIEYELISSETSINLDKTTGIAKLIKPISTSSFKIIIESNIFYKSSKLKSFVSNQLALNVVYDAETPIELINLISSTPFSIKHFSQTNASIELIQLKLSDSIKQNETIFKFNTNRSYLNISLIYCSHKVCPFDLDSTHGTFVSNLMINKSTFEPTDLIVKLTDLDTLKLVKFEISYEHERFEHQNCSIRISLNEQQFQNESFNQISLFLIKMNVLNDLNQTGDYTLTYLNPDLEKCVLINPKSGNVFIKCKTATFLQQYQMSQEFTVKIDYKEATTYLHLIFDMINQYNMSEISVFNCFQPQPVSIQIESSLKEINLKKIHFINELKDLKQNVVVFDLNENDIDMSVLGANEEFNLIEDKANLFKLNKQTGSLSLAREWQLNFIDLIKNQIRTYDYEVKLRTHKSNYIINTLIEFEINSNLIMSYFKNINLPVPRLSQYNYEFNININDLIKHQDYILLNQIDAYLIGYDSKLNVSDLYSLGYSIRLTNINNLDLPFYIDSNGKLFYSNLNDDLVKSNRYDFNIVILFKLNETVIHELSAHSKVNIFSSLKHKLKPSLTMNQMNKNVSLGGTLDLSMPIISADFISNLQCSLIGFFNMDSKMTNTTLKLLKPKFKPNKLNKKNSQIRFNLNNSSRLLKSSFHKRTSSNSMEEYVFNLSGEEDFILNDDFEQKLLIETFYSQLYLDDSTGALYFNLNDNHDINHDSSNEFISNHKTQINQPILYSKLAKLINFYLYERNLPSKRVKVDAYVASSHFLTSNQTISIWIDLLFKKPKQILKTVSEEPQSLVNYANKFQINSNNLLNLFNNGDEFSLEISIEENYNLSDFLNLRKYFESKLDLKRNFINLKLIKQLEYYLVDLKQFDYLSNSILSIDDIKSGILTTKPSVQFDYEVEQNHLAKVMIVQHLNSDEIDWETNENKFVYWLDLNINILNQIDEPLVCEEPIYFIDIDENELKNKKLFTIKLKDYDAGFNDTSNRVYKSQIISGNAQGLFSMNDLTLYTGSSARKLDRETRQQHELDVKITETMLNTNQSRYATCKIVINLNDINDNRPIINDIELVIYNKLDVKLIEETKIPIANAIAIDPDEISKLTYTIASVRYLTNKHKRSEDEEHSGSDELKPTLQPVNTSHQSNTELINLFSLNSTNGNLYALKTEMPCVDCTILVQYRANDIGRLKTRVSRKSTIKLHIKPIPVSLFKINNEDELLTSSVYNSSIVKTFDLSLINSTETHQVVLNVNEDTKLGEKLYQIRIKNKQNKNELTLVYFCLLENDSNQTFYMSNHDGALYLIKHLDYEKKTFYNLTILITNWLGQTEYVNIQINVRDINDNRPMFESTLVVLNETINLSNEETKISLVSAFDLDEIDQGKLVFKLEDCFYMSKNLLVKKQSIVYYDTDEAINSNHLNYHLCSKQFIEIVDEWFLKRQSINLKLNLNNLSSFLQNSSDFYLRRDDEAQINFILDVSVRDQSLISLTRINLNLNLKQNQLIEKLNANLTQIKQDNLKSFVKYGFKKQNYFVQIKSREQNELIRFYNEFVWTQTNSSQNLFKPFDLRFYLVKNVDNFKIETNFGSVYFDFNNEIKEFVFKLTIGCNLTNHLIEDFSNQDSSDDSVHLFKTTNLIISIESSVLYPNPLLEDLVFYPIWSTIHLNAYIYENLPSGTWVINANNLLFSLKDYLSLRTLKQIEHILPSQSVSNSLQFQLNDDYFEVDPFSGFVRSKIETDYEMFNTYELKIQVCLINLDQIVSTSKICFRQTNNLRVHILNKNDNEPKVIVNKPSNLMLDLYNTSELIRSMSLFKFKAEDADQQVDSLKYDLIHVKSLVLTHNKCSDLQPSLEWFNLFQLDEINQCILLTDLGYDALIKLVSRINECHYSIELTVRVTDGLFTNQVNFYLNLLFNDIVNNSTYSPLLFIKSGLVAPIFNSIEFNENINTNSSELLVNVNDLLVKYLNSLNLNLVDDVKFDLKNYENYFYLNHTDKQLYIRKGAQFDREQRDSFELFIQVNNLNHLLHYFRILIKLNDFNDNLPKFYQPENLKQISSSLFELNQTFMWAELFNTNKTNPLFVVKASDLDSGLNGLIKYDLLDDTGLVYNLIKINERTGAVYLLNSKMINSTSLWQKYATNKNDLTLQFTILAQDQNQFDKHKSFLSVRLTFINSTQNENVYFNKTFYEFNVYESLKPNFLIGYVNSLVEMKHSGLYETVFTLIDSSNQFEIDHRTGGLFLKSSLDYEIEKKYYLTVCVYNTFNPERNQLSNATVLINVLNVNDNEPKFSSYEYEVEINENIEKMTQIFQLNATDLDQDGPIKYQLLNHLDKFYLDEQTGIVYNKVTFDYESMLLFDGFDLTNSSQYSSFEYLNLIQLKIRAFDKDGLETECILTIKILNINDNSPQFERAVFTSNIQIYDNEYESLTNETILNYLKNSTNNETNLNSLQFVTKVTAKDIDSKTLVYSILKQTQIEDELAEDKLKLNSLAVNNLFVIDSNTGLVYVDLIKFKLLKKISQHYEQTKQSKLKQIFTFSIQLAVSDFQLTSYSRLTVLVESIVSNEQLNLRPQFKTNLINLSLNLTKLNLKRGVENSSLINLNKHLISKSNSFFHLELNLDSLTDLFSIKSNRYLFLNLKKFNEYLKLNEQYLYNIIYQLPITACNTIQTGLCDQLIIRLNLTDLASSKRSKQQVNESKKEKISFAYEYASVTIQQQQQQMSTQTQVETDLENNTSSEDDYDFDYNYEANERFYFEIKTNNQLDDDFDVQFETEFKSKHNYEFELFSCVYSTLNVTYSNGSLGKQIKQFLNQNNLYQLQPNHHRLTLQQLKSLFSLNKHNGVLSSRKIINSMLPGVYSFNIRLKTNSTSSNDIPFEILDAMQFKLIILPPNNYLKFNFKNLHSYFKFNREFYKFKIDNQQSDGSLGQIKLINRSVKQTSKVNFSLTYKLIESKHIKQIFNLIELNSSSGEVRIKNVSLEQFKPYLKNDYELTVYALALVNINSTRPNNNTLEYMCEIVIDFKQVFGSNLVNNNKNYLSQLEKSGEFIKFGRSEHSLKLVKSNFDTKLAVFKFLAFMHTTEHNLSIQYSLETNSDQDMFRIDPTSGVLYQLKQLNTNELKLKVKACVINDLGLVLNQIECALTSCLIQLIETNDSPPKFENSIYNETIREDALPGTVVTTVVAYDLDSSKTRGLDYFILDGDYLNQFAISSDGKIYTRLMLDRELKRSYELTVMAFDGKFKSIAKVNINVLDVNDNRPHCNQTLVQLSLSESIQIGGSIYQINAFDLDKSMLTYEIITKEENNLIDQINLNKSNNRFVRERIATSKEMLSLPFGINDKSGTIRLIEQLDYESQTFYEFYVRVVKTNEQLTENQNLRSLIKSSKSILPWSTYCLIKFEITIIDENDNPPVFNQINSNTNLVEHSPVGSLVTKVKASDSDSPTNSAIVYSILNNDMFEINSKSGLITLVNNNLDREQLGNQINLTIRASDSKFTSDTQLQINLLDINDNKPIFNTSFTRVNVDENIPIGSIIARIKAFDLDTNSTTLYSILNKTNEFIIDKTTGDLIVNTHLDYETKTNYLILIEARDPHFVESNSNQLTVQISLNDLNDNVPQFNLSQNRTYFLDENMPVNTTVVEVRAFDLDKTSPNNEIDFNITNGNYLDHFGIDKKTGRVFNKIVFDYEMLPLDHELTIECSDNGKPFKLKNSTRIKIRINNLNDNSPQFERKNQTLVIRENHQLNTQIVKLQVNDLDFNEFKFKIIDQFKNQYKQKLSEPMFDINSNGSLILVNKPLNNQTYTIQVRCFDSGVPVLYADTFLTIKITDEMSNEPKMNNSQIEIITISDQLKIESNYLIGQMKASDQDNDKLTFTLSNSKNEPIDSTLSSVIIDKNLGSLKTMNDLSQTQNYDFKVSVTDNKFITESDLNIQIKRINSDCFTNSLFIKFNVWKNHSNRITLSEFYRLGYMKRFKEMLTRIMNTNKNNYEFGSRLNSYNTSNVIIIGLRHVDLDTTNLEDETNLEPQQLGSIVEILFAIKKQSPANYRDEFHECLDSKLISKMLNKRRATIIKRMRLPLNELNASISSFKFKLIDLSFNGQCKSDSKQVCTTNVALQNCVLKLKGYYESNSLCETNDELANTETCYLTPRYEWNCESTNELTSNIEFENSISLLTKSINQTKSKVENKQNLSDKYGSSCKKPFNPCKNNGICKQVKVGSLSSKKSSGTNYKLRIHCFCPNGFKGAFCEEDIDECSELDSNVDGPCIQGARCQNTYGSYICNCSSHPPSNCYNTLSPQYSASTIDKTSIIFKSHKYSNYAYNSDKKRYEKLETKSESELLNEQDDYLENDEDNSNDYLLFGSISTNTVKQALLGVVGAVCGILIILTFAAGIICKMNINRRRLKKRYLNETELHNEKMSSLLEPTHSHTDSGDGLSDNQMATSSSSSTNRSNNSSPISFKDNIHVITKMQNQIQKIEASSSSNEIINNYGCSGSSKVLLKTSTQSTSGGTCSLTSGDESNHRIEHKFKKAKQVSNRSKIELKKNKYTINNLLFAKLNSQKVTTPLLSSGSQATSSICESLGSSVGCSPSQVIKNEPDIILNKNSDINIYESDDLNDLNETYKINSKYLLNGMSSFGRNSKKQTQENGDIELKLRESYYKYDSICSISSKDNIKPDVLIENKNAPFIYNTSSLVKPKTSNQINYFSLLAKQTSTNTTTFVPIQNKETNDDKDDSTLEDNTQGFYWDVTDWADTEIDVKKIKKKFNNKTDLPNITSHLPQLIMHQLTSNNSDSNQTLNSPIYSSNFKSTINSKTKPLETTNDDITSNINTDDYLKETSTLINFEISSNYMYLVNTDLCNNEDDTLAN